MKQNESNKGKEPYLENGEPCEAVMMNRRRFRGPVEDFKFPKRANELPKHVVYFPVTSKSSNNSSTQVEGKAKGVGLQIISIKGKEATIRTAVTVALVYYTESTSKRRGRAEY